MQFKLNAYIEMYLMSEDEISWTNTLYPQYQVYENRLNTFIDRSWPISLYQNEVTLAEAGFFYSGNGDIVICAFCGIHLYRWLPKDDQDEENEIHETTNKDIDELNRKISGKLYLTSHIKLVHSKLENGLVFQINIILENQKRW